MNPKFIWLDTKVGQQNSDQNSWRILLTSKNCVISRHILKFWKYSVLNRLKCQEFSSIRLILGQVWTCLDLYDANWQNFKDIKRYESSNKHISWDKNATKRKSYNAYKNLQENFLYFRTFNITNISRSSTKASTVKSHIESPGWKE